MLAPSMYSFKSPVPRVVGCLPCDGRDNGARPLFPHRFRAAAAHLTQLPSVPAGLTRLARILLLAADEMPAPRQVVTAQVIIGLHQPDPGIQRIP